jgi:hypothetical protein
MLRGSRARDSACRLADGVAPVEAPGRHKVKLEGLFCHDKFPQTITRGEAKIRKIKRGGWMSAKKWEICPPLFEQVLSNPLPLY